ncbi:MAG: S26 family signal peptidase [Planctomycetota bacterium]
MAEASPNKIAMPTAAPRAESSSIKEFLTGIVIAFTMAFIFRGFVIEGFLIPTGSMAPTLLGKHIRVTDEQNGYEWTAGPWDYADGRVPLSVQGAREPIELNDPMTGNEVVRTDEPLLAGDRLFVMKYLAGIYEPDRWDVVVFKVPTGPQENYIKRLLGLPGEQIALVDGDVFYRAAPATADPGTGVADWSAEDWSIARKDERTQRVMLQPVFDSFFAPSPETQENLAPRDRFRPPWETDPERGGGSWEGLRGAADAGYRYSGSGPTSLVWDTARYPLDDYTPYNQTRSGFQSYARETNRPSLPVFPVSDVAVRLAVEPETDGQTVQFDLQARGLELRGVIESGVARLMLRAAGEADGSWTLVDEGDAELPSGAVTNVEFWHVDQALWLFVGGELVAGGTESGGYDLTPAERVRASTGTRLDEWLTQQAEVDRGPLTRPGNYVKPSLSVSFAGGPMVVRRTIVSRDIFYQPRTLAPSRGAHPSSTATLSQDHYMFCGDNSANSEDARAWNVVDPWVSETIHSIDTSIRDPHAGLVHRELLTGRAFVVYLPSPVKRFGLPMLDFGRMRWVW